MPSPRLVPADAPHLTPREWANLDFRQDPVVVLTGDPANPSHYDAREIDGVPGIQVWSQNVGGALITGSVDCGDEPPCSVRVHDGADDFLWDGVWLTGSDGRGLRITTSQRPTVRNVTSWAHLIECIILGDCPGALLEDLILYGSRDGQCEDYTDDKKHGLYISGNAHGTILRRLYAHHVTGSGLQINGASLRHIIDQMVVEDVRLAYCGSGGTPALSMMAVCRNQFSRFRFEHDVAGITMFGDGLGNAWSCHANTFTDFTMDAAGKFFVHELEGSGGNTWVNASGFTPPAGDLVKSAPSGVVVSPSPGSVVIPQPPVPQPGLDPQLAALLRRLAAKDAAAERLLAEVQALRAI